MVKGITYILVNDTGVRGIVGKNNADSKYKVYPNVCSQPETAPYVVVRQTGKTPVECKDIEPNAYVYSYQAISFHKSYDDCESLDRAVVDALRKPSGGTYNAVVFQDIRHTNTSDAYEKDYALHVKISTFEALVNEDQAT